jgi:uncharacterized repeat protein (TIGR03803 family)
MNRVGLLYVAGAVVVGCGGAGGEGRERLGSISQPEVFTPRPNVGVDFVGGGSNGTPQPLGSAEFAGAVPYRYWRSVAGATGSDLVNTSDGAAAEIQMDWSSAGTLSTTIADNGGNSRMMKGYLNTTNTSTTTVTFNNLPPSGSPGATGYATADVYVYFDGHNVGADRTGTYTLTSGATTKTISAKDKSGVQFSGTFTAVTANGGTGNYVKFAKVALGTSLTVTAVPGVSTDTAKRAPINAIQIIPDADGGDPVASVVQAPNGTLYGVNFGGGAYGNGTAFSVTTAGTFNLLHTFIGDFGGSAPAPEGANPYSRLDVGPDGNFYGTTESGGASGYGVVFKMTPSGAITVLHDFTGGADDAGPTGRLIVGSDGLLYGTTSGGAVSNGSVYRVKRDGTAFTTLYKLALDGTQGMRPAGGLKSMSDGNYYGVAQFGGPNNQGVVFRVTPAGGYSIVHAFNGTNGSFPNSKLTLAADGKLYGTTEGGTGGSVFAVTTGGAFTNVFTFQNALNQGSIPQGEILRASDNALYGVTRDGGANGGGTVFKIAAGVVTPRWLSFPAEFSPRAGLIQGTDGHLYGTAAGNDAKMGSIYKLTTGKVLTILRTL